MTKNTQPTTERTSELHDLFEPLSGNAKNTPTTDPKPRAKHKLPSLPDRDTLE